MANLFADFKTKLEETPNFRWEQKQEFNRLQCIKSVHTCNSNMYYIHSGCVRAGFEEDEKSYTVRFGYSGSFIAALKSYFTEQPCNYFIQALRKTTVTSISKVYFEKLLANNSELQAHWICLLQATIMGQLEREEDLLSNSPDLRLHRLLQRSPQVFQEVPHKYIADYLRMSPETLSRLLTKS